VTDPRPPKTPWMTIHLTVSDAEKTIAFCEQAFGFVLRECVRDGGVIMHVEMTYEDELVVMFAAEGAYGGTSKAPLRLGVECPVQFYLICHDVDAMYQRCLLASAKTRMEPADMFWGHRFAQVEDADGYIWGMGKPL